MLPPQRVGVVMKQTLCASVADQPDPLPEKPWHMGGVVVMSVAATVLALFAKDTPGALMAATGATGFAACIVTAYGRRGLGLAMAALIAFFLVFLLLAYRSGALDDHRRAAR